MPTQLNHARAATARAASPGDSIDGAAPAPNAHRNSVRTAWRPVVDLSVGLVDGCEPRSLHGPPRRVDARVVNLATGPIDLALGAPDPSGWTGLLILDGLIMVHLEAGRAQTGWLIGADDLVVPWNLRHISLTATSRWRALAPTRVAMLDREFSSRAAGVPALLPALVSRAASTTSWLLAKSLVMACPGVEERLLLVFALYGERWGIVRRDGVLLKLPLTHHLLATLCGVRRPSVTLALHALEAAGVLTRESSGSWLLTHGAAADISARHSCWPQYSDALGLTSR